VHAIQHVEALLASNPSGDRILRQQRHTPRFSVFVRTQTQAYGSLSPSATGEAVARPLWHCLPASARQRSRAADRAFSRTTSELSESWPTLPLRATSSAGSALRGSARTTCEAGRDCRIVAGTATRSSLLLCSSATPEQKSARLLDSRCTPPRRRAGPPGPARYRSPSGPGGLIWVLVELGPWRMSWR
jgi:hypothetical protein